MPLILNKVFLRDLLLIWPSNISFLLNISLPIKVYSFVYTQFSPLKLQILFHYLFYFLTNVSSYYQPVQLFSV